MLLHLIDSVAAAGASRIGRRRRRGARTGRGGGRAARRHDRAPGRTARHRARRRCRRSDALAGFDGTVIVCFGDAPFLRARDDAAMARAAGRGRCAARRRARLPSRRRQGLWPDHRRCAMARSARWSNSRMRARTNARSICAIRASPRSARPICGRCSTASATTMPRANIICPTSSCWRWRTATARWWSKPMRTR